MRSLTRIIAAVELLLIFPAAPFLTALVVRNLRAAMNHVHASRTEVPRGLGHISMGIALGISAANVGNRLLYA